jgi:hypothetical protein
MDWVYGVPTKKGLYQVAVKARSSDKCFVDFDIWHESGTWTENFQYDADYGWGVYAYREMPQPPPFKEI